MSKTMAIVRREFLAFVRTKWFVIGTLFGPLLMSLFIVLPILFAEGGGSRRLVVVDATGGDVGSGVVDATGRYVAVESARRIEVHDLEDGNHQFEPRQRSRFTLAGHRREAILVALDFLRRTLVSTPT